MPQNNEHAGHVCHTEECLVWLKMITVTAEMGHCGGWIHTDSLRASREASKLSGEVGKASWRSFQMKTLEVGRAAQSYCFWTKVPVTIKILWIPTFYFKNLLFHCQGVNFQFFLVILRLASEQPFQFLQIYSPLQRAGKPVIKML